VMSAKANQGAGTYADRWGTVETVKEKDKDGNEVDAEVTKAVTLAVPGSTPKGCSEIQHLIDMELCQTYQATNH
jgi:hypothetical protein